MGVEEHEVSAIVKLPAWQGLDVLIDLQAARRAEFLTLGSLPDMDASSSAASTFYAVYRWQVC